MEYGERWAAGDKKFQGLHPQGRKKKKKVDIAFQQTDCTCHHEKPLLIAEQYGGCVEAHCIMVAEFPWFCLVDAAAW